MSTFLNPNAIEDSSIAKSKLDTALKAEIDGKQDTLTAGAGINITDNKISCTLDTTIFKVVDSLPTAPASGDENKIHLVLSSSSEGGNTYDEYLWVNNSWERIGSFRPSVDLSRYAEKSYVDSQIDGEATARTNADTELQTQINGKQDNIGNFSADEKAALLVSLGLGKIGVISQKQNWNAVGVEPAYVMSDKVEGFISQDNIDSLISYGFVYNEETGYFELNGLTDISLQEALGIVAVGKPNPTLCDIHFAYKKIRTNLPILDNQDYNGGYFGNGLANQIRMGSMALNSDIEVFVYGQYKQDDNYVNSGFKYAAIAQGGKAFNNCQKLEKISIIPGTASRFYEVFTNCLRLKELELVYLKCDVNLGSSSLLSAKSIHIMIANANNTGAITITLHSDAKARWEASEYYAEDSRTIVTKNITIA